MDDGMWTRHDTPVGTFHVACVGGAVVQSGLPGTTPAEFLRALQERFPETRFKEVDSNPLLQEAGRQLRDYAGGALRNFSIPLRLHGTAFQHMVWNALADIPYGEVRSYQEVARAIGRPGASRAVGQANHDNPVAPFIPCHRVVTSSGTLGGYGGGMELKRELLRREGVQFQ